VKDEGGKFIILDEALDEGGVGCSWAESEDEEEEGGGPYDEGV
jgi:hypothetical protein